MVKAKINQMWRGQYVAKDEPYPEKISDKESERLINAGLAYSDEAPTMSDNKEVIQQYCADNDIAFTQDMTKQELINEIADAD